MSCRLVTGWGGLGVFFSAAGGLVNWSGGVRLYREREMVSGRFERQGRVCGEDEDVPRMAWGPLA